MIHLKKLSLNSTIKGTQWRGLEWAAWLTIPKRLWKNREACLQPVVPTPGFSNFRNCRNRWNEETEINKTIFVIFCVAKCMLHCRFKLSAFLLCIFFCVHSFRLVTMSSKVSLAKLALASGSSVDVASISEFDRKVYEACARIPAGNLSSVVLMRVKIFV